MTERRNFEIHRWTPTGSRKLEIRRSGPSSQPAASRGEARRTRGQALRAARRAQRERVKGVIFSHASPPPPLVCASLRLMTHGQPCTPCRPLGFALCGAVCPGSGPSPAARTLPKAVRAALRGPRPSPASARRRRPCRRARLRPDPEARDHLRWLHEALSGSASSQSLVTGATKRASRSLTSEWQRQMGGDWVRPRGSNRARKDRVPAKRWSLLRRLLGTLYAPRPTPQSPT